MASYSIDELNEIGIRQWEWIKKDFSSSSILLGNGFSINFSNSLRYKYLYDFFIAGCSNFASELFRQFDTKNFESVLESLETAKIVCDTLKISSSELEKYKSEIREGLIASINQMHPRPINVNYDQIKWISRQFEGFNNIFTTNYDLFLYYIILEIKKFGDHLFTNYSNRYNCFENPDTMRKHHIYYLHGALFLFEQGLTTLKIKRLNDGWLLDEITAQISANNYPLFISEGKSLTKLKSIQSNPYLRFCMKRLEENSDKNLVVFGQSLSEQDEHIVRIIDKHYAKVAVSIRSEDWDMIGKLRAEKNRLSSLFTKAKFEFYDAKSLFNFEPNFLAT
jgi:hypothetical protein